MKELLGLTVVTIALLVALFITAKKWARGRKSKPRQIPKEWLLSALIVVAYTARLSY